MVFRYSSVVPAPRDEVFDWHTRPGALARLAPPWHPVRPLTETGSLRDGTAVLGLPGGVRWVAAHLPERYDPPRRFADRLVSRPLAPLLSWTHVHDFAVEADDATLVTDRIATTLPNTLLRPMFVYRHAQLADDLAAGARARAWHDTPVTVAVTGASGLVGRNLCALLTTGGHRVIRLVRRTAHGRDERRWDPGAPAADLLDGVDAVVHLAGEPLFGRFTEAHRAALRDSRVGPTRALAEVAAGAADGPRVFVTASAIGYYGPTRGDEVLTEDSPRGDGFLADLVADWESAARPSAEAGLRCVQVRTGIVQTPAGGVLGLQYPLFAAGLGGRIGDGRQWLSWIGVDDLADVYVRAVLDGGLAGPVNAVAPNPVRGAEHARVLAATLRRPAPLPVPAFGPALLLGRQGAEEVALADQRVAPERLRSAGHTFRYPRLDGALAHLFGRHRPA
ncbi:TIGR01777 family oxidoreductase [Nocardiopsis sp. EMB25]|uniref:TIGR01777 family oxidoreductase n=1 Tax=Nocardiopsis sp. EMB25 TaxID=2835867 RepID=UPI0022837D05|nr:TIGR01777 family oxidoreductase [Nocardiopsis sp. EMB25]MCY9783328.1 TIGR01777 family oxidoreductase [Nocardiopsis sp. EMB25]